MRHTSRATRNNRRATANRNAAGVAYTPSTTEIKQFKRTPKGVPYYTNDTAQQERPWQACLGSKSDRLVPGNVAEIPVDPATPKDRNYPHTPLTTAQHLWADTLSTSDSCVRKGARYQTKLRGNIK